MSIRTDTGRVHPAGGQKLSPAPAESEGLSVSSVPAFLRRSLGTLAGFRGPCIGIGVCWG